jgi:hypothetical protein
MTQQQQQQYQVSLPTSRIDALARAMEADHPTGEEATQVVAAFEIGLVLAQYGLAIEQGMAGLERDGDGDWYVTNGLGERVYGPLELPKRQPQPSALSRIFKR